MIRFQLCLINQLPFQDRWVHALQRANQAASGWAFKLGLNLMRGDCEPKPITRPNFDMGLNQSFAGQDNQTGLGELKIFQFLSSFPSYIFI